MVSSGLLRRVALVRIDVSEEPGASFIRVGLVRLMAVRTRCPNQAIPLYPQKLALKFVDQWCSISLYSLLAD
jgi:type IV pilus biogenesis protein CpaD/CtpE